MAETTMTETENKEVQVSVRENPFALGHADYVMEEGISVAQMIARTSIAPIAEIHDGVFVFIGDELIERSRWNDVKLVRGSAVSVGVTPAGGGAQGKDPARTVAMIAVMVVAIVATYGAATWAGMAVGAGGLGLGTTGAGIVGGIAGAAVGVAGSMLVNALIPLPSPKSKSDSGPNYISGMSNTMDPYGPISRLLGAIKVFPKYAAIPYSELVGTDENFLRALFCIGKGKYALSEFKIGDTDIADFSDVEIETYYTGDTTNYRLFPADPYETPLTIELDYNTAEMRTTGAGIDELTVELTFPQGLYRISSGGSRKPTGVAVKVEYSVAGANQWRDFATISRVALAPYASNSITEGQSVTGPSGAGIVRFAHHNSVQSITGYDEDLRQIYGYVSYVDYVDIEVTSGSFALGQELSFGGAYLATAIKITPNTHIITGEYGSPFKKSFTCKVPRGQYDVRVTRLTADQSDEYRTVYWTSLRTITYQTPFNLTGCTLVGLRIKASGQLSGMIDQFNCKAEALLNAYDGSAWHLVKTRSPAWAFVEVLCGTANKRPVSTSRLNLGAIRNFDLNCAAAGFNFDAIVDYRTTVWELLRQICAAGRATPGMTDNLYTVIQDLSHSTPVQHFSPRNSWGFSGSRTFPDIPHALRVRFMNSANGYTWDECVVYDDGYTAVNATNYETIEFFGVTSYNHCWKLGRYHIACLRLRPESYVFTTDVEHMVCTRGDMVRLTHDVMMVGLGQARIRSVSTTQIVIDDVFSQAAGPTYGFQFRRADGTFTTATIATIPGENPAGTTFAFSPAMNVLDVPAAGDLCFFGEAGSESVKVLVSRIDPGPDLTARLTCIPYNPAILTADGGPIPEWSSDITVPPVIARTPPKPRIISAIYIYRTQNINADGTYELVMSVGFDAQSAGFSQAGSATDPNFQPVDVAQGFEVQYREDDGNWIALPALGRDARSFEFPAKNGVSYDIRIRSFSVPGVFSDWDLLSDVTTNYIADVPGDVSGLQAVGGGTSFLTMDLDIEWTAAAGGGADGAVINDYKIEVRTSDGNTLLRTEYVLQTKYTYSFDKNVADGGPRPSVQIRVWARNKFQALSATYASAVFTNPPPQNPQGLSVFSPMGGCEFNWSANTEPDFRHFAYKLLVGGEESNISYVGIGTAATGTTPITPSYPAGILAGDLLVMSVINKYPASPPATPAGWTPAGQAQGGAGSSGDDSGQVLSTVFVKEAAGGESGTVSVTVAGANSSSAIILAFRKTAGTAWDYAATGGSDNSAGTSWSAAGAANPGIRAGDLVVAASAANSDAPSFSAQAVVAAGVTGWSAAAEMHDAAVGSGNDMRHVVSRHPVLAGDATGIPTFTMTGSSTSGNYPAGATVMLRLRTIGYQAGWQKALTTNIFRLLTQGEKDAFGADATIYLEVKAIDAFNQESGSTAISGIAGSLNIKPTDIADFAITASKMFTKIPIPEGLTLANNSPSAGYLAWGAFTIYYNGAAYSIAGGNTNLKFVYWKDLAGTLSASDSHPPTALADWKPQEDFIIAVNIAGAGQEAWNAIANQVIGSAYIMNAAINDAHVASLSGTKIQASSSVAIGASTFGADGIQLEYNGGNPRFYAGNGAGKHITFDGTDVELAGKLSIVPGGSTDAQVLNSYNLTPGNYSPFSNFEGKTDFAGNVLGGWSFTWTSTKPPSGGINYAGYTAQGANTIWWMENGPIGGAEESQYSYVYTNPIPVIGGRRYCFSAYTGAHRAKVLVYAVFYDAADAWISTTGATFNDAEVVGGASLASFKRHESFGVAPANAVKARLYVFKYQTKVGQTSSYVFTCLPCFSEVGSDQVAAPPWVAGGTDNSGWADSSGMIAAAGLGTTIIQGGKIITSLLTADNIQTGTLNAGLIQAGTIYASKIVSGDISYTQLGVGAAATYGVASGIDTCYPSVTKIGGDRLLIIVRGVAQAGYNSGGESGTLILGLAAVYLRRDHSGGTQIAYSLVEGRDSVVEVIIVTIDEPGGTGSQTYYCLLQGYQIYNIKARVINLRR